MLAVIAMETWLHSSMNFKMCPNAVHYATQERETGDYYIIQEIRPKVALFFIRVEAYASMRWHF